MEMDKDEECGYNIIDNSIMIINIGGRDIGLITDAKFSLDQDCPGITITRYLQLFENEFGIMNRLIKEKIIDIDEGYDITVKIKVNNSTTKNIIYKKCTMYDNEIITNMEDRSLREICYFDAESLEVI
jgi:hypothetical protein